MHDALSLSRTPMGYDCRGGTESNQLINPRWRIAMHRALLWADASNIEARYLNASRLRIDLSPRKCSRVPGSFLLGQVGGSRWR